MHSQNAHFRQNPKNTKSKSFMKALTNRRGWQSQYDVLCDTLKQAILKNLCESVNCESFELRVLRQEEDKLTTKEFQVFLIQQSRHQS